MKLAVFGPTFSYSPGRKFYQGRGSSLSWAKGGLLSTKNMKVFALKISEMSYGNTALTIRKPSHLLVEPLLQILGVQGHTWETLTSTDKISFPRMIFWWFCYLCREGANRLPTSQVGVQVQALQHYTGRSDCNITTSQVLGPGVRALSTVGCDIVLWTHILEGWTLPTLRR